LSLFIVECEVDQKNNVKVFRTFLFVTFSGSNFINKIWRIYGKRDIC